jgi:hypothetical protein
MQKIEADALVALAAAITGGSIDETAISATVLNTLVGSLIDSKVGLDQIAMVANGAAHGIVSTMTGVTAVNAALNGNTILGRPYFATGLLPDGTAGGGTVIAGDFSKFAIGYWGGIDLVINPYSLDLENQIRVSIHRHFDTAMLNASAFRIRQATT